MPATLQNELQIKLLSVRLPEAELRRLKTLAVQRGITVQEAVHQALESWMMSVQSTPLELLDDLEGSLLGVDVAKLMREERASELVKDGRWS